MASYFFIVPMRLQIYNRWGNYCIADRMQKLNGIALFHTKNWSLQLLTTSYLLLDTKLFMPTGRMGGRPSALDKKKQKLLFYQDEDHSIDEILEMLSISKSTLSKIVRKNPLKRKLHNYC